MNFNCFVVITARTYQDKDSLCSALPSFLMIFLVLHFYRMRILFATSCAHSLSRRKSLWTSTGTTATLVRWMTELVFVQCVLRFAIKTMTSRMQSMAHFFATVEPKKMEAASWVFPDVLTYVLIRVDKCFFNLVMFCIKGAISRYFSIFLKPQICLVLNLIPKIMV